MIKKEIKSHFLGTINGIEFENPELYERWLTTLNLIETEKSWCQYSKYRSNNYKKYWLMQSNRTTILK